MQVSSSAVTSICMLETSTNHQLTLEIRNKLTFAIRKIKIRNNYNTQRLETSNNKQAKV